jgi:CheY-like chemotaxis protein
MNKKNTILWIDDEIDLLESHIIYLTNKGYSVVTANSGEDAIIYCREHDIDLVLLDEMMTGIDGIETLKRLKVTNPHLPIIMVTRNEEEDLIEEALSEKISYYLTKPVNPSQILIACKKVLDNKKIIEDAQIKKFLDFTRYLQNIDYNNLDYNDWIKEYQKICDWALIIDNFSNIDLKNILEAEREVLNNNFSKYIVQNYKSWFKDTSHRPTLSCDIFDRKLKPIIRNNKKLIFIIIDCFRLDQWKQISSLLNSEYEISEDIHFSIIPTATPFARNAIFSGMMPLDIKNNYPDIWNKMISENKLNSYEDKLFRKCLDRNNFSDKSIHYEKISNYDEGIKFYNRINDFKDIDILAIVVNFVDILGHSRSESNVLKELIPNESAYRLSVYNWFKNSWLKDCLYKFQSWDAEIIITSDHGNRMVSKPTLVKADHTASQGIRYKYGRNLNINSKEVFKVETPHDYLLPMFDVNTQYIIARDNKFFVYSNQYNKYSNIIKNTFQHGGISLEEMIVPLISLKKKK